MVPMDPLALPVAQISEHVRAWWAPALAFAAGLVSFASPCVLPLVPGYLSFITGGADPEGAKGGRRPILPVLLFILGFTVVFTLIFGFAASSISRSVRSLAGQRVAGVFVLLFGALMLLYALRAKIPFLYREGRPLLSRVKPGPAGAFPLGMAFAVGWTPCIGPVLGAILTLAANQGSTLRTVGLLFVYSLGLGVPFLLIGLGIGRLTRGARFFARNYHWIAGASGVALVAVGVLLVTGNWTRLVAPLFRFANRIGLPI